MSARQRLGGASTLPDASIGRYAPSNSILIPADLPFERGEIAQALIDVGFVLFISFASLAIAGGFYLLFLGF